MTHQCYTLRYVPCKKWNEWMHRMTQFTSFFHISNRDFFDGNVCCRRINEIKCYNMHVDYVGTRNLHLINHLFIGMRRRRKLKTCCIQSHRLYRTIRHWLDHQKRIVQIVGTTRQFSFKVILLNLILWHLSLFVAIAVTSGWIEGTAIKFECLKQSYMLHEQLCFHVCRAFSIIGIVDFAAFVGARYKRNVCY